MILLLVKVRLPLCVCVGGGGVKSTPVRQETNKETRDDEDL